MEKKLTMDERYTAYCIMLQEASRRLYTWEESSNAGYTNVYRTGLCKLSNIVLGMNLKDWAIEIIKEHEFLGDYICDPANWKPRIALLKQCIIETSNF